MKTLRLITILLLLIAFRINTVEAQNPLRLRNDTIYMLSNGDTIGFYVGASDVYMGSVNNNSVHIIQNDGDAIVIDDSKKVSLQAGTGVDEFSTDTTMAGNSDDVLPTEKAVKTYIDNKRTYFDVTVCSSGCDYTTLKAALSGTSSGSSIYVANEVIVESTGFNAVNQHVFFDNTTIYVAAGGSSIQDSTTFYGKCKMIMAGNATMNIYDNVSLKGITVDVTDSITPQLFYFHGVDSDLDVKFESGLLLKSGSANGTELVAMVGNRNRLNLLAHDCIAGQVANLVYVNGDNNIIDIIAVNNASAGNTFYAVRLAGTADYNVIRGTCTGNDDNFEDDGGTGNNTAALVSP